MKDNSIFLERYQFMWWGKFGRQGGWTIYQVPCVEANAMGPWRLLSVSKSTSRMTCLTRIWMSATDSWMSSCSDLKQTLSNLFVLATFKAEFILIEQGVFAAIPKWNKKEQEWNGHCELNTVSSSWMMAKFTNFQMFIWSNLANLTRDILGSSFSLHLDLPYNP